LSEERKKFEEEIQSLKSAMAPTDDETDNTRDLSTRAEFVARVRKLGDSVLAGVKHGWQNAIAQIKVANPGVELSFDGMGVFREVVDGQVRKTWMSKKVTTKRMMKGRAGRPSPPRMTIKSGPARHKLVIFSFLLLTIVGACVPVILHLWTIFVG
jgi:hypothetical protein